MFDSLSGECDLSETAVMRQLLRASLLTTLSSFVITSGAVEAAQVRGSVQAPPKPVEVGKEGGYARTQVSAPAKSLEEQKQDVTLFLYSKESLPIPAPEAHQTVTIRGRRFTPDVAACAVDAEIVFDNQERDAVTVVVNATKIGPIQPGEKASYTCAAGEPEDPRVVRVEGIRFMSGLVYVGQIGVAARPNEAGYFSISAPQGTYELQYLTKAGIVMRKPVEIERSDVNVGAVNLAESSEPEGTDGE
ncbi:MAG: hypothetical protein RMA76_21055 [Deltaproteobacteria bacterium]